MIKNKVLDILSKLVGISIKQVEHTVTLLDDGGTIPFISRYRKEQTGGLNEVEIRKISEQYDALKELVKRKEYILDVISEAGKLTDELTIKIASTMILSELEDIYRPYKQKKRTRATIAKEKGLEPLATIIYIQTDKIILNHYPDPTKSRSSYLGLLELSIKRNGFSLPISKRIVSNKSFLISLYIKVNTFNAFR